MSDRDVHRLVLVGCSSSKADEPRPARDLYESNYWNAKRSYASAVGDAWRILSAEHVVLNPDRETAPYERHITDLKGVPAESDRVLPSGEPAETLLDEYACDVESQLSEWLRSETSNTGTRTIELEVLLGYDYEDPLRDRGVFESAASSTKPPVRVRWPFREVEGLTGIGRQMSWMLEEAATSLKS